MFLGLGLCLLLAVEPVRSSCTNASDCSLNGVCTAGECACDVPWTGPRCGIMEFAVESPAAGRSLYNQNDTEHNTWNGPMVSEIINGKERCEQREAPLGWCSTLCSCSGPSHSPVMACICQLFYSSFDFLFQRRGYARGSGPRCDTRSASVCRCACVSRVYINDRS